MGMRILVLTSTFPRWKNDKIPDFVSELSEKISANNSIFILAPHDKGAKLTEQMNDLLVYRFIYFLPKFENLAYRGGMVNRFRESLLAKIQLPFYLISLFFYTLYITIYKQVDIIHAHWLFPQGFVAILVKLVTGKKVIITTHGGDVSILNNKNIAKFLKYSIKKADKVTYVSRRNLEFVKKIIGNDVEKNAEIIPMGVDIPQNYLQVDNKKIKVLFIGRIVSIKGLDFLLRSIYEITLTNKDIHLDILGEGPEMENLQELTRSLKIEEYVTFHGYISGSKKLEFLEKTNIVVVSSIIDKFGAEEGLPVVALEAMAYGKILIATKTGGLPELINNKNGILIEPSSVQSLTNAINKVINNNEISLDIITEARKSIQEYSWSNIKTKFQDVFLNLTNKKSVLILSLGDRPSGPTTWKNGLIKNLFKNNVNVYEINTSSLLSIFKIFQLQKVSVIHGFHVSPASILYFIIGRLIGKKIVFTVHGDIYAENNSKKCLRKIFWIPFYHLIFFLADKITFPSFFLQNVILSKRKKINSKSIVIYNGIDIPLLNINERLNEIKTIQLLSITNFNHSKKAYGIVLLIDSVNKLNGLGYDVKLNILGNGRFYNKIFNKYSSDKIIFHGHKDNINEFFKNADIYVHSTLLDNFPYAILEAASSSLPVIAVNVGAISEMLPYDCLVIGDSTKLRYKIENLLINDDKIKENIHKTYNFIQKFSWNIISTEFKKIYFN